MTKVLERLTDDEVNQSCPGAEESGCGTLETARGRLPLRAMDVGGRIDGLLCQITDPHTLLHHFSSKHDVNVTFVV